MTTKTDTRHPFGELLAQYRARKPGLTQTRLAELAGYNQAILVRMAQGKKDLTGPSGRERVVRLTETLADQGAMTTLDEANALLLAADMPPLFERNLNEARLITRLSRLPVGQRTRRTNLPAPLTSFVGRAQEIAEVRRLLGLTRLLTLTGAGGCGKTRLAQRIAADVLITYSEGVWYTELAALTDPALIPDVVARALGLIAVDRPAKEQVLDYLRERQVLLVLDNCEHLIDAVAAFSIEVLRACPRVTILTTSREALNVEGETAWRVPPMQPDEAGRLFVDRAAAARSDATLSAQDKSVAHICQRLDGMPLAIELAAARLSALSLSDIAARLEDRFALLSSGRRGALPRHQTLRALMDWSYDALSELEKIVFRRLGVFVGGCELEQAEQVVSDEHVSHNTVLPALMQLVAKSLVVMKEQGASVRYHYLETVREYALEKMREANELNAIRRRHATAFCELAEKSSVPIRAEAQQYWLRRLRDEGGNWRAALQWCFGSGGDAETGCRYMWPLTFFWRLSAEFADEAAKWFATAKSRLSESMPPAIQADFWLAALSWDRSTVQEMCEHARLALSLHERVGNLVQAALAKIGLGSFLLMDASTEAVQLIEQGIEMARSANSANGESVVRIGLRFPAIYEHRSQIDLERAEDLYQQVLSQFRDAGNLLDAAAVTCSLSELNMERFRFQVAMQYAEEVIATARPVNDQYMEMHGSLLIGECLRFLGEHQRAVAVLEDCLALARQRGMPIIAPLRVLAKVLNILGDTHQAWALLKECAKIRHDQTLAYFEWQFTFITDTMACVASNRGDAVLAAQLFGTADARLKLSNSSRLRHHEQDQAPYIAKARAALGDAAYEAAYAEGRAMTLEQAIDYALQAT